jgi:hypothetical protein
MSIELTSKAVGTAMQLMPDTPADQVRAALTAVLDLPEIRQAIYEDVRGESDAKLKAMGVTGYTVGWDR